MERSIEGLFNREGIPIYLFGSTFISKPMEMHKKDGEPDIFLFGFPTSTYELHYLDVVEYDREVIITSNEKDVLVNMCESDGYDKFSFDTKSYNRCDFNGISLEYLTFQHCVSDEDNFGRELVEIPNKFNPTSDEKDGSTWYLFQRVPVEVVEESNNKE